MKILLPPQTEDKFEIRNWRQKIASIINRMQDSLISATAKIGTSTNNTEIESDGTIKFNGDATVWEDVPPTSVTVGNTGANFPAFTAYNGNLKAYEFVGTGPTLKEMQLGFQMPHAMKVNSIIIPHLHCYIPDNGAGGDIKFYCEYTWADINNTGALTPVTISGTITRTANQGIANNAILSFGNVTPTTGQGGISSIFMCRIYRDPGNVADTFGASLWLKSADIHVEMDTIGSRTATSK